MLTSKYRKLETENKTIKKDAGGHELTDKLTVNKLLVALFDDNIFQGMPLSPDVRNSGIAFVPT